MRTEREPEAKGSLIYDPLDGETWSLKGLLETMKLAEVIYLDERRKPEPEDLVA